MPASKSARQRVADELVISINPATAKSWRGCPSPVRPRWKRPCRAPFGAARLGARTGAERGRVLRRAADLLRANNERLAVLETRDTGKPIQETRVVDVASGADCFEYYAGMAQGLAGESGSRARVFGYTRREPLGVGAGIGAWNYPIQIACWKSAPALACGNAMIFKPTELTPLTAVELESLLGEAGVPDGLFQVVQGYADTGRLLTRHPQIRKMSLTGEVGTGKAVMADAAATLKTVTLELGGKSPLIIFEDADLENAVSGAMLGNFYSAGEVCSNGTRVFVQRALLSRFLERLLQRVQAMRIGDPMRPDTQVGSLISAEHLEKVMGYIARGRAEGARVAVGGVRVVDGDLANGNFVAPTVFTECHDDMAIVREEIFGPVMTVLLFDDEQEVIERANATPFGLAAGVFTRELTRAHRVIARLEAGTCWINQYNITPVELPFGGVKLSGLGRENGRAAIEHYTQIKSVYVAMGDVASPVLTDRVDDIEEFDYVIVGAGSAGLRARQSTDRRRPALGAAARVRRLGSFDLHPDAERAVDSDEHGQIRVALPLRARERPRRPPHLHAARQGARRILIDQRHGLRARQCAGL